MVADVLDLAGRLVVAGAFAWAAAGKLADLPSLRAALYLSRLTRPWVPQVSAGLPATELVLAGALLASGGPGWVAATVSALLLLAFTAYLALDPSTARGCSCFGARTATSRRAGVVRDVLLLAALVPALVRGLKVQRWGLPVPVTLPLAVVVAAVLVARALRRDAASRATGRPTGRRRAGVPPAPPAVVRVEAPDFDVPALDGAPLRLCDLARRPEGVVLLFVEPGCLLCEALLPTLAGRPDVVVLVAVDDPGEVPPWAAAHGLAPSRVGVDVAGSVADRYLVVADPAACRVDGTGLLVDGAGAPVARPAVGAEAIARLLSV